MRVYMQVLLRVLVILGLSSGFANAVGSYGLNKVQYEPFDWKLVQTPHFDIYYYQGGDSLAAYTAHHIEGIYDTAAGYLQHRLRQRIPVLLHNTHAQFEQTNVIRYPIPEAVGGFTEVFKNRIVLPFDGSYLSFHHVLQHELLHAMVFDLVSNGRKGYNTASKLGEMPLWMSEGNSEFGSIGWELGSEFFLLDAVTSGYIDNPGNEYGLDGYMAYKGGQSFLYFVESTWGKGSVAAIFKSVSQGLPFKVAFVRMTHVGLEEAGEIWLREIRRIYWPELGQRQYGKAIARAMTDHRKDQSFYNISPAISPDGQNIAFFSDRGNYEAVYILNTETEKITKTAVESGYRASHESFHPFTSSLCWAADSRHLVLVGKQGGHDVLHVVDTENSDLVATIEVTGLESMSSPAVSPDGRTIVISAQRNSIQDLYRIELPKMLGTKDFPSELTLKPVALTHSEATEEHPVFSPTGRYVAYQSNAAATKDPMILDKQDVFLLDLTTQQVRQVSHSRWSSHNPSFGEDDSLLLYVSNRSGVENLYMQETFSDSLWPISNVLASVTGASLSRDGNSVAFSLFEGGGWDVFLLKDPWKHRMFKPLPLTHFIQVAEDTTKTQSFFTNIVFENLQSYKNKDAMDSLEGTIRESLGQDDKKPKGAPSPIGSVGDDEGFFLDKADAPKPSKADSTKAKDSVTVAKDSTKTKDSTKVVDSVPVNPPAAPGWDALDTSKIFSKTAPTFNSDSTLHNKPYESEWSLDQAVAIAGYSSSNGMGGEGALTLSDLMGDQEINLWFFGGGSLDNINVYVNYGYLPLRLDMYVSAFHKYSESSEYMKRSDFDAKQGLAAEDGADTVWGYVPYGDRSMGSALTLSWPFSLYSRVDLGGILTWRTRTWKQVTDANYDGSQWSYNLKDDSLAAPEHINTIEMSLGWSFDNAQWGITGPMEGNRLWLGVQGIPPEVLQSRYGYWRADADMRKYFRIYQRYCFAFRAAGGMSEPLEGYQDPHRYLVGGDDMTINWHANFDHWHGNQEEVFFSSMETPLRGFRYQEFAGTRMGIFNGEFRFPFVDRLSFGWPIPLTLTNVTGVIFTDYGGTWDNRQAFQDRGWGYGWGWRLNLGVFVLRYTRAWSSDKYSTVDRSGYTYWSLGAEF